MSDNAAANKPAAWRVDVEGIGSIMPICRDWVEVQGICNRFGNRVFGVAPLYEETTTLPTTWIPVSERLPEPWGNVLIAVRGEYVFLGCFTGGGWRGHCDMTQEGVTHWMPLPAPPTE